MWKGFALALALCLLPWGGAESQGHRSRCKEPPEWSIGDQKPMMQSAGKRRLEDLRLKLEKEKFVGISYIVVNHQGRQSRAKYHLLKSKVSEHIPVYQQEEKQPDVWSTLNGDKDDFLIYDRCGRLVQHIELPYSLLSFSYVEDAIKYAYCEDKCGECEHKVIDIDVCKKPEMQPDQEKPSEKPVEGLAERPKHHRNHHRNQPRHRSHRHRHHHNENEQGGEAAVPMSNSQSQNRAMGHEQGQSVLEVKTQREADIPVLALHP
ncbi:hypothetical protein GDO86_002449 [Hymenochirus boettgeri]|uniref:Selenoprotein P N-terminal domain-containing protein n=1 Tax=Hymenochirus boettgeri TaxID=247094 RepID=A0A8T2KI43_9PIPI|nr:hypothetical protein GDO86_002449 [Hymenochirus boettgeri]